MGTGNGRRKRVKKTLARAKWTTNVIFLKKHAEIQNRPAENKFNPHLQNQQTLVFHRLSFVWHQQSGTELTLDGAKRVIRRNRTVSWRIRNKNWYSYRNCNDIIKLFINICTFLLVSLFISLFTKSRTLNNYTICKQAHTQQQF